MRSEKQRSQINYWKAIEDNLPIPILIGIEHKDGLLSGVQMNNPNTGRVVSLTGVELEALAHVFNESGFKIKKNTPEDANVV